MARSKQKKGLSGGEVILPRHIPSIWHTIDDLMKRKKDISDDEIKFVENFIKRGDRVLSGFQDWLIKKRKLHGLHAKKWQDVEAYKLAHVI